MRKELAELFAARALWLLLLLVGVLTGASFIASVNEYAEASGIGGGASALAQGLSPLDGIVNPSLGTYSLAVSLLFPFVAIRLVSAEPWKLTLQWPPSVPRQLGAKVVALLIAWLLSLLPFAIALLLWRFYGGHLDAAETLTSILGATLHFLLTVCIALAAAATMQGSANAAIAVLGITIGTWALDFFATGRGGVLQRLAAFTPEAALRTFESGLVRLDVVGVIAVLSLFAIAVASIWLQLGTSVRIRVLRTIGVMAITVIALAIVADVRASFDCSENRRNSFSAADELALTHVREPLQIDVRLAAEDPRMNDFQRNILVKLRRAMRVEVHYPLEGRSALFEDDPHYGEITYRLGNRTTMSRSTTDEIVLDTIEALAGAPVPHREPSPYPGYPLARRPAGAAIIFYVVWPLIVIAAWGARRMRRTG